NKLFGAFEALYTKAFIDDWTTFRNHPTMDGLVERVV
uniref:Uncharacterized protein n=1 Tax=Physcomitrium patens TaxID=3218 RepID=A0A7I3YXM7_PHYPA